MTTTKTVFSKSICGAKTMTREQNQTPPGRKCRRSEVSKVNDNLLKHELCQNFPITWLIRSFLFAEISLTSDYLFSTGNKYTVPEHIVSTKFQKMFDKE